MSNHKVACILLMLFIGAMLYGTQKMRARAVTAREAAEETKNQAEMAEQQRRVAEIKLKTVDSKTADLRTVYHEWLPHFEAVANPQAGEQRISELVRNGDIFLLSQKYEERELDTEEQISRALVATLVIEDDYTKTLNWLGKLEEEIPAARISKCRLIRGDRANNIHVELTVQVPVLKS
ncbi:MAG: hypothetical protein HKN23_21720 [Verrucomicrobiales bacterium]|nr:hypothetical protein [Verrucomicrobiales bacterium]